MSENQAEIDALLAEVNALANEAVSEIADGAGTADVASAVAVAPEPAPGGSDLGAVPAPAPRPARRSNLERVLHLEVPVIVRLAERNMPLAEILNLTSGAIIEFEKSSDGELDLLINNKCIGHGLAVKVGENFGLRINKVGSVQERIRALGA